MKIKVGNKIYDGEKDLVMVILTDKDKENIAAMHEKCTKYCQFPSKTSQDSVDEFMHTGEPDENGEDVFYFFSYTFSRGSGEETIHSSKVVYNEHPFEALKNIAEDFLCMRNGIDGPMWSFDLVSWREISKEEYNMYEKQNFTEMTRRLRKGKTEAFEASLKDKENNAQQPGTNGN